MLSSRGFSLIEILVTLSILAILSTIALVNYSNVSKNGRDAQRNSDLRTIQSILEQFRADQFHYPLNLTFGSALKSPSGERVYLNTVPDDPLPAKNYLYQVSGSNCSEPTPQKCTNYCLFAQMENSDNSITHPVCSPPSGYNSAVGPP